MQRPWRVQSNPRSGLICLAICLGLTGCTDAPPQPSSSGDAQLVAKLEAARPGGKGKGKQRKDDDANKRRAYKAAIPAPKRTFFISAKAEPDGDGTEARPWRDLQTSLCRLEPGDRLVMRPGNYRGAFVIDDTCKAGTAEAAIQVYAEEDAIITAGTKGQASLTMRKPFWVLEHIEIMGGKGREPAIVIEGPGAHDILLNDLHPHNGWTHGIVIGREARRVTLANSHIHNFGHPAHGKTGGCVYVEDGAAEIALVGNNIHTSMAGALIAGGRTYGNKLPDGTVEAPPGVSLRENEIKDNRP